MSNSPSWPVERAGPEVTLQPVADPGAPAALARAYEPPTPEPSDWQRMLAAAMRRKWLVILVTLAGTAAGVIGSRFLDPRFAARAVLWIEAAGRAPARGGASILEGALGQTRGGAGLAPPGAVLEDVARELRLYVPPKSPAD